MKVYKSKTKNYGEISIKRTEIEFKKYERDGAYHWKDISKHPIERNVFVLGRYKNMISLLKREFSNSLCEKKILDIGCGDTALSCLIAKQGAIISGIDNSEIAINLAKKKIKEKNIKNLDVRQGDAYALPYEDEYFDVVISSDVIEHLQYVDKYLQEMKRVLKVGGVAIISTPIRFTEIWEKEHVVEWFQSEFKTLINSKFPNSKFYESHPIFWKELILVSIYTKIMVNLLSYLKNPFEGFKSRFRANTLQYSVSKKE